MYLDIDGKSYTSIQEFYVKNKLLPKDKEKTPYDLDKTLVHRALLTKFRDNNQEPLFLKDILLWNLTELLSFNKFFGIEIAVLMLKSFDFLVS